MEEQYTIQWERLLHPDPELMRRRDLFLDGLKNIEVRVQDGVIYAECPDIILD